MAGLGTKSVCIVGAGPAGLVAAKTFLQQGTILVTVYEAASRVGGMWRGQQGEQGDKCSPEMRTNLSRFTVAFSDLSWSSVDLSNPETETLPSSPPMFPRAWQVGRYLEAYKTKFELESCIYLKKRVIRAWLLEDLKTWRVVTEDIDTKVQDTRTFDYLIIASGFFDKPGNSFKPSSNQSSPNIQHSSRFRDLKGLTDAAGKIVVVGGSISGSEASAQAALQISDAQVSPAKPESVHAGSKVYHIVNRPFYCLPNYLPRDPHESETQNYNLAPKFLPADLVLYNLSRRGDGDISAAITTVPPEKAQKGHEFMRALVGGDQRDLGSPELVYRPEFTQHPGYVGLTDTYAEFVRSGIIVPVQGWVDEVKGQGSSKMFDITLKQYDPWYHKPSDSAKSESTIKDVVGIIEATGYTTGLDYLDSTVRESLCHDPACPRIPFLLTRGSTLAKIPTIGFVGFYEGPYWGVMEMQARFISDLWTTHDVNLGYLQDRDIYQRSTTERMRHAIKYERSLQVPQFWMADYVGLVEEFSREVNISRNDTAFGRQAGPIFPSRYHSAEINSEAPLVIDEVANVIKASNKDTRFVAAAVFRGMQGIWQLQRKIDSRHAASSGGTFSGTANFHPRIPTSNTYSAEYLYIEEGTFTMDTGYAFPATRRYIYRYNEIIDKITAWFVDEDGKTVGALFNTWEFYAPKDTFHGWMAKGHHWCDPDTYKNTCEFRFKGANIRRFGITYQVEGPNKDYAHESWYERAARA